MTYDSAGNDIFSILQIINILALFPSAVAYF
jgi:hypothetical protein